MKPGGLPAHVECQWSAPLRSTWYPKISGRLVDALWPFWKRKTTCLLSFSPTLSRYHTSSRSPNPSRNIQPNHAMPGHMSKGLPWGFHIISIEATWGLRFGAHHGQIQGWRSTEVKVGGALNDGAISAGIPSRELTYHTLRKGKSSSKCHFWGYVRLWRVYDASLGGHSHWILDTGICTYIWLKKINHMTTCR